MLKKCYGLLVHIIVLLVHLADPCWLPFPTFVLNFKIDFVICALSVGIAYRQLILQPLSQGVRYLRLPFTLPFSSLLFCLRICGKYSNVIVYHLAEDVGRLSIHWGGGDVIPQKEVAVLTKKGNWILRKPKHIKCMLDQSLDLTVKHGLGELRWHDSVTIRPG